MNTLSNLIEKNDFHLVKCKLELVFNVYEYRPHITSKLFDNKTMCFWQKLLETAIKNFINKGYKLNHIAKLNSITIANKMDMSYDFHIKHNMHAVEWKLKAMINKNKSLFNKFNRKWRHPLNRKFESYRVKSFNQLIKLTKKFYSNLSQINIQYNLKLQIPLMHGHFFKIVSQNPEDIKTYCTYFYNPFHFACRKWFL